ncbi:NusA-like transcription termination signal-binding factor [Candidatus Woesearchaeota archaeon CG10_big_fil_rev_8_21_14_0_10_32_9]|nr:MAG: NusA-like transcription termination signal-binding factor [Candidatus Woesearchaeota archaeon CG10_big_fil_rev_8_21_14_0_10_32_9]
MKAKYDVELLKLMSLFEKITRADLKDCFVNRERVVFIVQQGEMGKALGKQKFNLQKIEEAINRKIKIVEFNPDVLEFIKNLMYPLKILEIKQDDLVVIIKGPDTKTKGLMIGARAQNLRNYEELVKKYFDNVTEIKVV